MKIFKQIIKSYSELKKNVQPNSLLETECLFGEEVEVLDTHDDFSYVRLLNDNYLGWLKTKHLGEVSKKTHKVSSIRTYIYSKKDIKSFTIGYLPFGSLFKGVFEDKIWYKVFLPKKKFGFVVISDIRGINHKNFDWVNSAELFENTPYRWGGRSSMGIDCSALLQLSIQTAGIHIPRNTRDQILIKNRVILKNKNFIRGDIIFWEGHVGVMIDSSKIIHANEFHMKTKIERLDEVIDRQTKAKKNILNVITNYNINNILYSPLKSKLC